VTEAAGPVFGMDPEASPDAATGRATARSKPPWTTLAESITPISSAAGVGYNIMRFRCTLDDRHTNQRRGYSGETGPSWVGLTRTDMPRPQNSTRGVPGAEPGRCVICLRSRRLPRPNVVSLPLPAAASASETPFSGGC
jgi:hypothetical protein